jgi:hypothetical protein
MNNERNANLYRINIDELAVNIATEIRENLSDTELNGINGGISSTVEIDPIKQFGCPTCRSGYDPRFDDIILKTRK